MIHARLSPPPQRLAAALAAKARRIAAARLAERRDRARAWRSARTLWPLFDRS